MRGYEGGRPWLTIWHPVARTASRLKTREAFKTAMASLNDVEAKGDHDGTFVLLGSNDDGNNEDKLFVLSINAKGKPEISAFVGGDFSGGCCD